MMHWPMFLVIFSLSFFANLAARGGQRAPVLQSTSAYTLEPWGSASAAKAAGVRTSDLSAWMSVPTGQSKVRDPACVWDLGVRSDFKSSLSNWSARCAKGAEKGWDFTIAQALETLWIKVDFQRHPYAQFIQFNLPGGMKLRGVLALRDRNPRPLVVLRSGIFSEVEHLLAERFLFMQLFEQSPFHLLILENMSSPEFIARNGLKGFAGWDEAMQNIWLLEVLQDPRFEISLMVSSAHLVGLSLGGHGALLTQSLQSQKVGLRYASTTLLCPLVDLQTTWKHHLQSASSRVLVNMWTAWKLRHVEGLDIQGPPWAVLEEGIQRIASRPKGPLFKPESLAWPVEWNQGDLSFWEGNDFFKKIGKPVGPLLYLSSMQDPLVVTSLNFDVVYAAWKDLPQVSFWRMSRGVHCSLPAAYDWRQLASILQSFVLSSAPEFVPSSQRVGKLQDPRKARRDLDFSIEVPLKGDHLVVRSRNLRQELKLADVGLSWSGDIQDQAEQEMWTRWGYQNLIVESDDKNLVLNWTTWLAKSSEVQKQKK